MRINNNIMALNTHRQYTVNTQNVANSTEKLSSGFRINRAGDDAAGLAISEKMRAQIRGLDMASKNSQDAISLVQTAEGALQETHSILQRMRELATQSASDTNETTVDRAALDAEFQQLIAEIDDIADKTSFNDMNLLDGSFGVSVDQSTSTIFANVPGVSSVSASGVAGEIYTFTDDGTDLTVAATTAGTSVTILGGSTAAGAGTLNISEYGISIKFNEGYAAAGINGETIQMGAGGGGQIQTGANQGDSMSIAISACDATTLAVNTSGVDTRANAEAAITSVNNAINSISQTRASLGAIQNRLTHKINSLNTSSENLTAAESRIRDVDMAKEMSSLTKNNILLQASTSMLAQANSAPQNVLSLLQ